MDVDARILAVDDARRSIPNLSKIRLSIRNTESIQDLPSTAQDKPANFLQNMIVNKIAAIPQVMVKYPYVDNDDGKSLIKI